eukprot:CAMPEP_0119506306 /NCGR_PEP_ID=MMETSP1344-20130328/26575_1 /TAXON_ID=236787 /ORGANISM="Florenciella parvula, Strain CCMP2471" /LENGTH=76 /DNA_ID=CAMNT_0007542831 /DNA_START=87 /DNA_END=313 /DNA_ORIENTATION=+
MFSRRRGGEKGSSAGLNDGLESGFKGSAPPSNPGITFARKRKSQMACGCVGMSLLILMLCAVATKDGRVLMRGFQS